MRELASRFGLHRCNTGAWREQPLAGAEVFRAGGKAAGPPIGVAAMHAVIRAVTREDNSRFEQSLANGGWPSAGR
ncbi:MAG: hypothetical protein HYX65_01090 [Gemmatimonadetes bacterium]|nr:hypothetical protein [Gemmatimonadota bacterium]